VSLLLELLGHVLMAAALMGGTFGLLELAGRAARGRTPHDTGAPSS
jgi:hypothetical protein